MTGWLARRAGRGGLAWGVASFEDGRAKSGEAAFFRKAFQTAFSFGEESFHHFAVLLGVYKLIYSS